MKFQLNCAPHLTMHEIIKKSFNCQFLSDVQFSVDGQIIYAHSLMLMMRSNVFEMQLKGTQGEQKLIPIPDCSYDNFLEFIRFIYTDECEINDNNGIALLKLAIKYKLSMLENQVNNALSSMEWMAQLYEHCVTDKYEITRNRAVLLAGDNAESILTTKKFLTFHPDAIDAFLQLKMIRYVTELQIFSALAKWINNYCELNQMSLAEGRGKFEHFIRQIRFPVMSNKEINDCAINHPELLNESDRMTIANQVLFGNDTRWISEPREAYQCNCNWYTTKLTTSFTTTFAVLKNMILLGLRVGVEASRQKTGLEITARNRKTNESETIQFTQFAPRTLGGMLLSLGDSLRLRPNFAYTIDITYLETWGANGNIDVLGRSKNTDLIYNNPENSVIIVAASENMIEMIFKAVPECDDVGCMIE